MSGEKKNRGSKDIILLLPSSLKNFCKSVFSGKYLILIKLTEVPSEHYVFIQTFSSYLLSYLFINKYLFIAVL